MVLRLSGSEQRKKSIMIVGAGGWRLKSFCCYCCWNRSRPRHLLCLHHGCKIIIRVEHARTWTHTPSVCILYVQRVIVRRCIVYTHAYAHRNNSRILWYFWLLFHCYYHNMKHEIWQAKQQYSSGAPIRRKPLPKWHIPNSETVHCFGIFFYRFICHIFRIRYSYLISNNWQPNEFITYGKFVPATFVFIFSNCTTHFRVVYVCALWDLPNSYIFSVWHCQRRSSIYFHISKATSTMYITQIHISLVSPRPPCLLPSFNI